MAGLNHQHDLHHHAHRHGHHNVPRHMWFWSVAATLGFAFVEAVGGVWSGSLALLSDAGHMVSDAAALALAAFAAWLSLRPPSAKHSYGFGRAEILAAAINALAMLIIVAGISYEAWQRFLLPQSVAGGPVMVIALLGLLLNIGLAWLLSRGEQTMNVRAALLHVVGDMLGSVAALVAGLVIYLTGWTPIDPLLSVLICGLIVVSAVRLLLASAHVMMEGVPAHVDFVTVGNAMAQVAGVRSVHDLHIWNVSSGTVALSAHVVLDDMRSWTALLPQLRALLHDQFGIEHTTIQPETSTHVLQPMTPPSKQEIRQG